MPVMDGVKLCKSVKQNLRTCHIPVYLLSAKVDIKYQLQGLQVGADDYIPTVLDGCIDSKDFEYVAYPLSYF